MFNYTLFIPRQTGKSLEVLAEELNFYTRKNWDASDLGGAVLAEFVKIHRNDSYKEMARVITGSRKLGIKADESPSIRFFREH